MEIFQCDICGGQLEETMKQSELTYKCPYCEEISYKTPDFEFYNDALKKYTGDLNKSIEISLQLGKYNDEAEEALENGNLEKALKVKAKSVSMYMAMVPGLDTKEQRKDFFTIEMHKYKQEFISEKGKVLHLKYHEAVKNEDLEEAVKYLIELEQYKIKECFAGMAAMAQCRRSIVDTARNFVKGQPYASQQEKEKLLELFGLNKGLIKTEEGFICPACGGLMTDDFTTGDVMKCPYCNNIFGESGADRLTDMLSGFSGTRLQSEDMNLDDFEALKNEISESKNADNGFSFSMTMTSCPHCGNMAGYEEGKKSICPNCKKEIDI